MSKITETFGFSGGWHFERRETRAEKAEWKTLTRRLEVRRMNVRYQAKLKADPELRDRYNKWHRAWEKTPEQRAKQAARKRERNAKRRAPHEPPFTCSVCSVQWSRVPWLRTGRKPLVCSYRCRRAKCERSRKTPR